MEDLTLDFQEITEICESSMNECRAQQQKAQEMGDLNTELMWLLAERELQKTLNTMLYRIRHHQVVKILEKLKEIY